MNALLLFLSISCWLAVAIDWLFAMYGLFVVVFVVVVAIDVVVVAAVVVN